MDEFAVLPDMDDTDFPYLSDETLLGGRAEKLIAGDQPGDDSYPADVQALAAVLTSLRAPARPHELAGQGAAIAAYKEKALSQEKTLLEEKTQLKEKGNVRRLPRHFGPKVGAATAVALVAFSGVAAAAVTGALPAPIQSFVHATIHVGPAPATHGPKTGSSGGTTTAGTSAPAPTVVPSSAPVATPVASGTPRGVGPVVGGASTAGLCHAFAGSKNGSAAEHSKAARNLQAAAAAAGQTVDAYCAPYLGGSTSSSEHGKSAGKGSTSHGHGHDPSPSTKPSHGHGHGKH